jgi:hypothetical protein
MPRKLLQRGDHGKGNRPVVTIADRCWPGLAYVTGQARTWRDYALFPGAAAGQPTPAPREPSPGIRASVPTQAKFFQHERSCRSPRGDTQPLRLSAILMSTFYSPGQRYAWSKADACMRGFYRCRSNAIAAVSALLKSSLSARHSVLGERAPGAACGRQSRVLLSRFVLGEVHRSCLRSEFVRGVAAE